MGFYFSNKYVVLILYFKVNFIKAYFLIVYFIIIKSDKNLKLNLLFMINESI